MHRTLVIDLTMAIGANSGETEGVKDGGEDEDDASAGEEEAARDEIRLRVVDENWKHVPFYRIDGMVQQTLTSGHR